MFTITSLTSPFGKKAVLTQKGTKVEEKPLIGLQNGPRGSSYTISVEGLGHMSLLDLGKSTQGWSVLINNNIYWHHNGSGELGIDVDAAGNVRLTGSTAATPVWLCTLRRLFGLRSAQQNTTLMKTRLRPMTPSDNPLDNVSLAGYDMVVAVTQVAINETMGEYLNAHPQPFALLGIADASGNVTHLTDDPTKSNCSIKGVFQLEKDATGKYINLIQLSTQKGDQTVGFNLTMQQGEFVFDAAGINFSQKQQGNIPWEFSFFVDLNLEEVALANLPPDVQKRLENVDPNLFSIQQLFIDLTTSQLDSIAGTTFPALLQTPAAQLLGLYLAQLQAENKPLFGVSANLKTSVVPPPTLAPTSVDFCITPFLDQNGKPTNPNLDTLNYLVMFNNNTPPATKPQSFKSNWVTDESIHGAMAIGNGQFLSAMRNNLAPILQQMAPVLYCSADETQPPPNQLVIELNPGVPQIFQTQYDAASGLFGNFGYITSGSDDDNCGDAITICDYSVSAYYQSQCNIVALTNSIQITGNIVANANTFFTISNGGSGDTATVTMPNTTFNWSVELQLFFDTANNGQLDLQIINPNFDSVPLVQNEDPSWWERFLAGLSGSMVTYTGTLGDLRFNIQDNIEDGIKSSLSTILAKTNHFILPGGNTFAFKNPQFTSKKGLASNITYLNPNT